jgi:hypothetical protein
MAGIKSLPGDNRKQDDKDFLNTATIEQKIDFYTTRIAELKKKQADVGGLSKGEAADAREAMTAIKSLRGEQRQGWLDTNVKKAKELVDAAKEEAKWAGQLKEDREAAAMHKKAQETGDSRLEALSVELSTLAARKRSEEDTKRYWEQENHHYQELVGKAKQVRENSNPVEKFRDQFEELRELLGKGLINSNMFKNELNKERASLLKGLEADAPSKYTGATKQGDWGEIVKMLEDQNKTEWAQKQLDALLKQLTINERGTAELATIRSLLSDKQKVELSI